MYKIDGEHYDFKKVFDSDEEADLFLEMAEATKSYREFVNGYLTVWYSAPSFR